MGGSCGLPLPRGPVGTQQRHRIPPGKDLRAAGSPKEVWGVIVKGGEISVQPRHRYNLASGAALAPAGQGVDVADVRGEEVGLLQARALRRLCAERRPSPPRESNALGPAHASSLVTTAPCTSV